MTDSLHKCFSEAKINSLTLRNRLIKAATFEGKCPGGVPSEEVSFTYQKITWTWEDGGITAEDDWETPIS